MSLIYYIASFPDSWLPTIRFFVDSNTVAMVNAHWNEQNVDLALQHLRKNFEILEKNLHFLKIRCKHFEIPLTIELWTIEIWRNREVYVRGFPDFKRIKPKSLVKKKIHGIAWQTIAVAESDAKNEGRGSEQKSLQTSW